MAYVPINTQAYVSAYAGVLAGMAVSGWIVDPASANYAEVAAIAGAFAEAFDQAWNNAADLNNLETRGIVAICQNEFSGRGPGSLDNPNFLLSSNWTVPAAACAALVLEGDAYLASQSIDPGTGGASAVLRADWSVLLTVSPITFDAGLGPQWQVVAEAGTFAGLGEGQTLFIPPEQALQGFFHSGTPAPQFGGVWDVFVKIDDQNLTLQRNAAMSTSAQVDALALITVDGGSGVGVYQVITPKGGAINIDPQVIPEIAIPVHVGDGNTYFLVSQNNVLLWQIGPINGP
jgi:hypothetical protein